MHVLRECKKCGYSLDSLIHHLFNGLIIAFRRRTEIASYLCTVHEVVTVLYARRFHGLDAILDRPGTFASILCVQFFSPGSWYLFCDTRSQMKRWRFSVYYRFVYSFSRSFQLSFFIQENFHSKIIGCVDIMLTMRSAHCICFYGFKQDQLRSTIFNSITNYIFSLLKAIYSVVFAFVCHHF